jgi:hypothetical protein
MPSLSNQRSGAKREPASLEAAHNLIEGIVPQPIIFITGLLSRWATNPRVDVQKEKIDSSLEFARWHSNPRRLFAYWI